MTGKSLVLMFLGVLLLASAALATSLGGAVVEAVTVGAVVNAVSEPADDALNSLLGNRNLPPGADTRVVPVLSLGERGYVGAAQLSGSESLVKRTRAVFQLETSFDNQQYRVKLLMPMDSVNPLDTSRVRGVGVSALVDVALSRNAYLVPASRSFSTGDAIRSAAIVVATREFGPQLDDFINSVFRNHGGTPEGTTKVVPYLSFGEKAYIGMMQVAGPQEQVNRVQAVWQYEDLFDQGRVRLRALVPSDSLNPLAVRRVGGVGCTAIIDAMALRARERERDASQYTYFDRAGLFVGLGEDPHYRPPGWDRGRKVGWARHGDPSSPPGQQERHRNRRGRGH